MSTFLDDLIHSLKREAEETGAHLRTYPPPRLMGRTVEERNLKRIEQRLATLQDLQLQSEIKRSGPETGSRLWLAISAGRCPSDWAAILHSPHEGTGCPPITCQITRLGPAALR